jgi:hypothetical protein
MNKSIQLLFFFLSLIQWNQSKQIIIHLYIEKKYLNGLKIHYLSDYTILRFKKTRCHIKLSSDIFRACAVSRLFYSSGVLRSSQVSSKFRVYKFLVFSEIPVRSFKPPILDYTNRECQPCWVGWWCSRKTSAHLRARISLKTTNL